MPRCVLKQAMERVNLRSPLLDRAGFVVMKRAPIGRGAALER
jgi:hypothetical protein